MAHWNVFLLDPIGLDKLREEGIKSCYLKEEQVEALKVLGPVPIEADTHAQARSAFYKDLVSKPWFGNSPLNMPLRKLSPYIYVRTPKDNRNQPEPDLGAFIQTIRDHQEKNNGKD